MLDWLQCPKPGDKGIEVILGHITQVVDRHRQPQHGTVWADTLRQRIFDLLVGPATDSSFKVRRDVGRNGGTPGAGEIKTPRTGHALIEVGSGEVGFGEVRIPEVGFSPLRTISLEPFLMLEPILMINKD